MSDTAFGKPSGYLKGGAPADNVCGNLLADSMTKIKVADFPDYVKVCMQKKEAFSDEYKASTCRSSVVSTMHAHFQDGS